MYCVILLDVHERTVRARARARGKTRNRCLGRRVHDRGGPHPQGTHTEGRTPQRTHHRRGGPHRGPTHNTHRQKVPLQLLMNRYGVNPRDEGPTQGTHTGDPHRGDPHRGPTQGTRTGDPHRGPTQRGGPRRGPTTGGESHTEDPHITHIDKHHRTPTGRRNRTALHRHSMERMKTREGATLNLMHM